MTLLGEIRKRSWLLITLVGLGMGGFLLMDMLGNQSSFGNPNLIGKIDGKKVLAPDFYQTEAELFGESASGDMYERRDQVWEYLIQRHLLDKAKNQLGIDVSEEELAELFNVGPNLSPVIVNFFGGYQQFDVEQYNQIKSQADNFEGADRDVWNNLKDRVRLDRRQTKLNNLITKAVYTPNWMAEMTNAEATAGMNFQFVAIPFASISDEEVTITDADIKKYISERAYEFTSEEETRKISYVTFNVVPTAADSAAVLQQVADLVTPFATAEDDSMFITDNYGIYEQTYYTEGSLSPMIEDTLMKDLAVGSVYGPYLEGRKYKAVKLIDRMIVPDSIKARHILIQPAQELGLEGIRNARKLADSLVTVLKAGTTPFDSLAANYSADNSNKDDGGKLDWATPGTFVKPFENLVFYKAKIGEYNTVETQFGIHIVQVTDSKNSGKTGVKVAYISEDIIPSQATIKEVNNKAFSFVTQNRTLAAMEAAANEDAAIAMGISTPVKASSFSVPGIGGGTPTRDMVKWLFEDAKVGEVSTQLYTYQDPVLFYDNKFVVAALHSKQPKGLPSVNDVRATVEASVRNQKKGEAIVTKIAGNTDLAAIASQFQSTVQDANGVKFSDNFVQGLGNEPKVIGAVFNPNAALNTPMTPIVGNAGVFVVKPTFKAEATAIADLATVKQDNSNQARAAIGGTLFQAMKSQVKIVDKRTKFY